MSERLAGKVAIVTGAGRGIGRGEALELARLGAHVVVNDFGGDVQGNSPDLSVAEAVVSEIEAGGGVAAPNGDDVADFDGAQRLVEHAIETFGRLDIVVNNAGILRDRTIANMSIDEWDAVIRVHLRGTFAVTRHAAAHWKALSKQGEAVNASVINTSSASGIYGNPGQGNYGAAKAGIAAFTIIASQELKRYGVRVNAIAPTGLTRMTEDRPFAQEYRELRDSGSDAFNALDPGNIAPVVAWLASDAALDVTGRVFDVLGGRVRVAEPWRPGPEQDKGARWEVEELDSVIPDLLERAWGGLRLKEDV